MFESIISKLKAEKTKTNANDKFGFLGSQKKSSFSISGVQTPLTPHLDKQSGKNTPISEMSKNLNLSQLS